MSGSSSANPLSVDEVGLAERAAGDREPVDDRVLFGRQLVQAIGDELLERRRQRLRALAGALDANQHVLPVVVVSRISSVPRSSSASTISSRKNGLPATCGTRSASTSATPSRTPRRVWTRRICSSAAEAPELDAHDLGDGRRDAFVGRVTKSARMGSLSLRFRSLVEKLEARAIAPLQALEHHDERLPAGEGREQVAHAGEDELAAVADVLFVAGCHLLPGDELGQASREELTALAGGERAEKSGDVSSRRRRSD